MTRVWCSSTHRKVVNRDANVSGLAGCATKSREARAGCLYRAVITKHANGWQEVTAIYSKEMSSEIVVHLGKAADLKAGDFGGKSDPFVELFWEGDSEGKKPLACKFIGIIGKRRSRAFG